MVSSSDNNSDTSNGTVTTDIDNTASDNLAARANASGVSVGGGNTSDGTFTTGLKSASSDILTTVHNSHDAASGASTSDGTLTTALRSSMNDIPTAGTNASGVSPGSSTIDGTTSSVASNVFAIPEILENILLQLPTLDLLLAQRVSKTFHGAISSSVHIKRALFFEVRPETQREKDLHIPPELNPLLSRMFPKDMIHAIDITGKLDHDRESTLDKLRQNVGMPYNTPEKSLPMIFDGSCCKDKALGHMPDVVSAFFGEWVAKLPDTSFFLHLPSFYGTADSEREQMLVIRAQKYYQASWRRMYATNKPTAVHACLYLRGPDCTPVSSMAHWEDLESARMGHIMSLLDPQGYWYRRMGPPEEGRGA